MQRLGGRRPGHGDGLCTGTNSARLGSYLLISTRFKEMVGEVTTSKGSCLNGFSINIACFFKIEIFGHPSALAPVKRALSSAIARVFGGQLRPLCRLLAFGEFALFECSISATVT